MHGDRCALDIGRCTCVVLVFHARSLLRNIMNERRQLLSQCLCVEKFAVCSSWRAARTKREVGTCSEHHFKKSNSPFHCTWPALALRRLLWRHFPFRPHLAVLYATSTVSAIDTSPYGCCLGCSFVLPSIRLKTCIDWHTLRLLLSLTLSFALLTALSSMHC